MKTVQYAQQKTASQKPQRQDPTMKFALVYTKYALRYASRRQMHYVLRAVDRNPQVPPTGNAPANWCLSLRVKVSCHCEPVRLSGVAIPLLRGEMYRIVPERVEVATIFGGNRYLVPFNRGIATPVCALARNDSKYSTNTNLSYC